MSADKQHRLEIEFSTKIESLEVKVAEQDIVIRKQAAHIKQLEEENKQLKIKLNSSNSSLPPSSDMGKKPNKKRSLRTKTGKKTGGQKGHKGSKLNKVTNPDEILHHKVSKCKNCAVDLNDATQQLRGSRQVFDLPPIEIKVTEHRQYEACCPDCGQHNIAPYPKDVNKGQTQYGVNIRAQITYMSIRQYMPMSRLVEFISILSGQTISQGTVHNILRASAQKAKLAYEYIRNQITKSEVVGSDESGCNVKGEKHWLWVFQTPQFTFFKISKSRGYDVIEESFPDGLKNSIIVSDCWAAQLKTPSRGNQICIPHLVRNLNELIDRYQSKWAYSAKGVMVRIMRLCQQKRIKSTDKIKIEDQLDQLLQRPLTHSQKKVKNLKKRLIKYRKHITTCLYNRKVPPDNNASERAVRNMKVKIKVSGLFRSKQGADDYAILRSAVDTAIKQDLSPFQVIIDPNILIK